jgi:hypothetical protein
MSPFLHTPSHGQAWVFKYVSVLDNWLEEDGTGYCTGGLNRLPEAYCRLPMMA